jgi:hypothetical protein
VMMMFFFFMVMMFILMKVAFFMLWKSIRFHISISIVIPYILKYCIIFFREGRGRQVFFFIFPLIESNLLSRSHSFSNSFCSWFFALE